MRFKRRKDILEAEKVGLHSRYIRGLTSIFDASKKRQISNDESFWGTLSRFYIVFTLKSTNFHIYLNVALVHGNFDRIFSLDSGYRCIRFSRIQFEHDIIDPVCRISHFPIFQFSSYQIFLFFRMWAFFLDSMIRSELHNHSFFLNLKIFFTLFPSFNWIDLHFLLFPKYIFSYNYLLTMWSRT